jgi:tetratricopeptide (TPR) repeat protein
MATTHHQLAIIAHEQGDYDHSLDWCRQALTIREQLGDRAGMAGSYHQLGMVAQERGHYDQALDWYRQALALFEELGDRAGMVATTCQIGSLSTETGDPADGVKWNLHSVAIGLEIRSPNVAISLRWLVREREMLGSQHFEQIVRGQFDEESTSAVLDMLEQWSSRDMDSGETDAAPG